MPWSSVSPSTDNPPQNTPPKGKGWSVVKPAAQPSAPPQLDTMLGHAITSNPFVQGLGRAVMSNPIASSAMTHVAAPSISAIGKALDVQGWLTRRQMTGETDTNKQMAALRQQAHTYWQFAPGVHLPSEENYQRWGRIPFVGHIMQGAYDTALQTATDPLTYETAALGPVLKSANLATRALNAMDATPLGRVLYDFTHWGGKVARQRGVETVQQLRGAANLATSTAAHVQQRMLNRFDTIVGKLSEDEQLRVGQALNGQVQTGTLSPGELSAYRQLRTLTEMDYRMRVNIARQVAMESMTTDLSPADRNALEKAFRAGQEPQIPQPGPRVKKPDIQAQKLENRTRTINARVPTTNAPEQITGELAAPTDVRQSVRYTFQPENQAAIEHATMLRDRYNQIRNTILENMPHREHYMPWAHEGTPTEGREASTFNITEHFDPRALERENIPVTTAEQVRQGFQAMSANLGRQVQTGTIRNALGDLLKDPEIAKLFEQTAKATGSKATDIERVKDVWLTVVGYPRAAAVSLTPRHTANILDLLVNTVPPQAAPQILKDTMALAGKLVRANPKEYAALTKEGREMGAISGSFRERQPFFQNVPVLRNWTALNNKLTWAVDEAAKQTYAKYLLRSGEAASPLQAGGMASERLVDYANLSPLVKNVMRYISPFGTFRGSIPGAVVGGIVRNPARAAFLNRATGGTMYGGRPQRQQHGITLYNPTADVGRGIERPGEFIRSTLADPLRAAGTIGMEALTGSPYASAQTTAREIADIPNTIAHIPQEIQKGQTPQLLPQPHKPSKYADIVRLRAARYLTYGNPVDLRWLLSAAAAGVPEAQNIITEMRQGQFQPRSPNPFQSGLEDLLMQGSGIGIR